ncbi:hypothetical protein B6U55_03130 [Ligilactobacillus salivarius]|uniref:helix-turn-helix domain-containing protein n=1 Tax=Ligilactobacillus salivarius TaxID=1624 RepID=UPI0009DB295C|nr:helix-turn-helix transcriptional regulator [Ligilactobacillus salivarius]OQQ93742.1 hypothetical protein B6U55_03130 [Ligilactobacillus salivarius]
MNRLRQVRKQKGLTLVKVAEDTGVSIANLSRYESVDVEPRRETWIKLADYYDVPVAYLMGLPDGLIRYADEYIKGQNDMLALIKDAYYRADKETFEQLLDAEDEDEVQNFLKCDYIKQGMKIERARLLREIKELADRYGINI